MNKLLSLMFLLVLGTSAFAQKKYLTIYTDFDRSGSSSSIIADLSGDIPEGMSNRVTYGAINALNRNDGYCYSRDNIGRLFNILSEMGYTLESTTALANPANPSNVMFVFSRGSSNPMNSIQRVAADPDEEVVEIARYNLQGMPINESEKGVQIIVYSNYTTKTIIKE